MRKAIAKGVAEGTFAYTSLPAATTAQAYGSQPALGPDGKFQVSRDKVVVGRTLAEDEIDFESGFLMVPAAVPEATVTAGAGPTPVGPPLPVLEPGSPTVTRVAEIPAPLPSPPDTGCRNVVRLRFKATRGQLFKAFPAIANLADKSDDDQIVVNIEGTSSKGFDPSWLRNAVEEPLDEADIEHLSDGQ